MRRPQIDGKNVQTMQELIIALLETSVALFRADTPKLVKSSKKLWEIAVKNYIGRIDDSHEGKQ